MTVTLWLALTLQFVSVALLRLFLGKAWLRRPGTLLVLASVVYDGISQVLLSFPSISQWDTFRNGIQPGFIAEADLLMSAGMLAFTVAYLLTCGPRREAPAAPEEAALAARVLDWRILALACLPLAVLTYEGRGYNTAMTTGAGAGLATSTAAGFFVLLAVLAAFAFLLRHGTRWFLPVLAAQSVVLAAAGERSPVVIDAIVLALLLAWSGRRPAGRQVSAAVLLTVVAVLAIAGVRAEQGRSLFTSRAGFGARVSALGAGVTASAVTGTPGLAAQAAGRLDGVSFAAAIVEAEHSGQPRLAAAGVPGSLLIAVPSAAWHSKVQDAAVNPYQTEINDFGLQQVNYLPSLPGLYAGLLPMPWLVMFLGALGVAWALAERWVLRCQSPARMVMLAGMLTAALHYEEGLPAMLVVMRSAAVVAVLAWLAVRMVPYQAKWAMIRQNPAAPFPPAPEVQVPPAM
jgi:hypothetical protein